MSFRNTVRVSKLQSKNNMVMSAFNVGGHSLESLEKRDREYLEHLDSLDNASRQEEINKQKENKKFFEEVGASFPFKTYLLTRLAII
jgi:hypothetical protein